MLWVCLATYSYGADEPTGSPTAVVTSVFPAAHTDDDASERVLAPARHPARPHTEPTAPSPRHTAVNVRDDNLERTLSGSMRLRHMLRMAGADTALTREILEVRNQVVKKWTGALLSSQFLWYRFGNVAEGVGQGCQVLTIVFSGCAAGFDSKDLALAAMCTGTIGMALSKFSKYAHNESAERGNAANRFLAVENVTPIPVIKDSTTGVETIA